MLFWTNEEFKVFIEAMEERPVGYTIFTVMYYTGLRVGELLALTPEDTTLTDTLFLSTKTISV